ncbi:MAG: hypothetical protein ACRDGT_03360 [Candidatus Limnocylindria bacterium]
MQVPTILITGPVGVGKTTLMGEMGEALLAADVPHATVDFDQLRACHPRPAADDVWGTKLGLANLAAIWRNYMRAGASRLLIARVIESRDELSGFEDAVPGAAITVVRLRASVETLRSRVHRRGPGSDMQWHLNRAGDLARLMERSRVEDLLVETEGREPRELAAEVLATLGWIKPR